MNGSQDEVFSKKAKQHQVNKGKKTKTVIVYKTNRSIGNLVSWFGGRYSLILSYFVIVFVSLTD